MPEFLIIDPWIPVQAPLTNGSDNRSAANLAAVMVQFDVVNAQRYSKRVLSGNDHTDTFCNIFVADVTAALAAPIPHWWLKSEFDVDGMLHWCERYALAYGWRKVSEEEARTAANAGQPAVAGWCRHVLPSGHVETGHIAMLLPTPAPSVFQRVAAAGARCLFDVPITASFGVDYKQHPMMYFIHP
jgi:hypothetical protein